MIDEHMIHCNDGHGCRAPDCPSLEYFGRLTDVPLRCSCLVHPQFAPLTGLEIQRLSVEGSVLVPDVRLSVNLNASTIEKVIGRRRKLLEDMGDSMAIEVRADLSGTGFEDASVTMLGQLLLDDALAQHVMWYNVEENFQEGVAKVIDAKRSSLAHEKRLHWLLSRPSELAAHAEPIVKLLREPNATVRRAALVALGAMEPTVSSPHTSAIVQSVRDADENVRQACVKALGNVEPSAVAANADAILSLLQNAQQPQVRHAAILALGYLEPGKLAQYARPLVARLTAKDGYVRKAATTVLGRLHANALMPHSAPVLLRLEDPDSEVR